MFLAVDVGNTQTKLALFDGEGAVVDTWRLQTSADGSSANGSTADEALAEALRTQLAELHLDDIVIEGAGVACVVPAVAQAWQQALADSYNVDPIMVSGSQGCPIELAVAKPEAVGPDRVANAVALREVYGAPAISVDFGTATNIEVVDANGVFVGGAIMPGVETSAQALFARAARISNVPIEPPDAAIGTSTEAAVQSGVVLGAASSAEGLVRRMQDELASSNGRQARATVVATGGMGELMAGLTDAFDVVDRELTLRGIFHIWKLASR